MLLALRELSAPKIAYQGDLTVVWKQNKTKYVLSEMDRGYSPVYQAEGKPFCCKKTTCTKWIIYKSHMYKYTVVIHSFTVI